MMRTWLLSFLFSFSLCPGARAEPLPGGVSLVRQGTTISEAPPLFWYRLANGLNVLVLSDSRNPRVRFQVRLAAGSQLEKEGQRGLAHVLEHMMFRKVGNRDEETFEKVIRSVGGFSNAWTNRFWVLFHASFPAPALDLVLEEERSRFLSFAADEKRLAVERDVVASEYRMRFGDRPLARGFARLLRHVERGTPWEWPTIGTLEDIKRTSAKDLSEFHATYYLPDNAVVAIGGPLPREEMLAAVAKNFGSWKGRLTAPRFSYAPDAAGRDAGRTFVCGEDVKVRTYRIVFRSPGASFEDTYWRRVVQILLNNHEEGSLSRRLRRRDLARDMTTGVEWDFPRFQRTEWELELGTDQSLEKAMEFLKSRRDEVRKKPLPSWVKDSLYASFKEEAAENSETMTSLLSHYEERLANFGDPFVQERAPAVIERMTTQGLHAWMDANFDFSRAVVMGVVPANEAPPCSENGWKEQK